MTVDPDLRERREALVVEHMESENDHDFETTMHTFLLKGTHKGPLRGIPATGRKEFSCRTVAFFLFEGDSLVCERVYFDAATILSQLGLVQPAPSLDTGGG